MTLTNDFQGHSMAAVIALSLSALSKHWMSNVTKILMQEQY
jgi:hypothetical protein